MKDKKIHKMLLVLFYMIIQVLLKSVHCSLSYENKDFIKMKQDPTRYLQASAYKNIENIYATRQVNATTKRETNDIKTYKIPRHAQMGESPNYCKDNNNLANNKTITKTRPYKKWQVGRVSRKQYEIINMLWRKTKLFVDMDLTTTSYQPRRDNDTKKVMDRVPALRQPISRNFLRSSLPSTTPSYIEFYYLDESDEHGKEFVNPKFTVSRNMNQQPVNQLRNLGNFKFILSDSPMFAFRIDDPNYKRSAVPTRYMHPTNRMKRRKTRTHDSSLTDFESLNSITPHYKFMRKQTQQSKIKTTILRPRISENTSLKVENKTSTTEYKYDDQNMTTTEYPFDNETCPDTAASTTLNDMEESEDLNNPFINVTHITEITTAYDKIKFFEMYDKQTPVPYYDEKGKLKDMEDVEIYNIKGNDINTEGKVRLEHIDQSIGNEHSNPHKAKHFKKHIIDSNKSFSKIQNNDNLVKKKVIIEHISVNTSIDENFNNTIKKHNTKQPLKKLLHTESKTNTSENKESYQAKWSQYPFAAAYVFEPSQVHCDAAGISPHWLITSGACLSRHHKNPGGEGRSAFVTYCGESWWNPERVAYVKYSLVHPRFHPRDKTRRHLYNIGLIQVVTSMASACAGWAPISLMSHQFIADVEGSQANAIGWGLDRFDTRYSSGELPKSKLMSYKSQVFSDSCPGNVGYSKAKRHDDEGGIKNVYCLLLPPYSGEESDPIHGGILVMGGKLLALYLQEERRPWGEQCAQYTGTWRLVPWVLNVARETDETDSFTIDI